MTVYDKDGNVESRERHMNIASIADVVRANEGKQIVRVVPGLSPDQKQEMRRRV